MLDKSVHATLRILDPSAALHGSITEASWFLSERTVSWTSGRQTWANRKWRQLRRSLSLNSSMSVFLLHAIARTSSPSTSPARSRSGMSGSSSRWTPSWATNPGTANASPRHFRRSPAPSQSGLPSSAWQSVKIRVNKRTFAKTPFNASPSRSPLRAVCWSPITEFKPGTSSEAAERGALRSFSKRPMKRTIWDKFSAK